MTETIDYRRDSLAEITLKQAETIEQQSYHILSLLMENHALRENADSVISAEHDRLMEALLLVEGWTFKKLQSGKEWMSARAMYCVLTECLDYAENSVKPAWFDAAHEARAAEAELEAELEMKDEE
jgi:hypothetical protein